MIGECVYFSKGSNSVCRVVVKMMGSKMVKGEGYMNSIISVWRHQKSRFWIVLGNISSVGRARIYNVWDCNLDSEILQYEGDTFERSVWRVSDLRKFQQSSEVPVFYSLSKHNIICTHLRRRNTYPLLSLITNLYPIINLPTYKRP